MAYRTESRREFLRKAATTAGAGAAIGGCATQQGPELRAQAQPPAVAVQAEPEPVPQPKELAPGEKIRVGFIGVGGRGSSILQSALEIDEVDIVAVCDAYDVWRNRALAWCRRKRSTVGDYIDYDELLEQEELHAVVVATPDHLHAPIVLAALDRGLDVYTEKPMTHRLEDAAAIRDRAAETGAVLQVGTQLRSMGMYQQAREVYQRGDLGQLIEVRVNRDNGSGSHGRSSVPEEATNDNVHWDVFAKAGGPNERDHRRFFSWRLFLAYGNGVIGDLMLHHLDLCHFITGSGMPSKVAGMGGIYQYNDGRTAPDTVSCLLEYPEGFHFNYTTTLCNGHYGLSERYLCTDGLIEVRNMGEMSIWRRGIEEVVGSQGIQTKPHLEDFFDAVRARRNPIAPVTAGFMGAACCDLAMQALLNGQTYHWDYAQQQPYVIAG